jgi:hypothetical protein
MIVGHRNETRTLGLSYTQQDFLINLPQPAMDETDNGDDEEVAFICFGLYVAKQ